MRGLWVVLTGVVAAAAGIAVARDAYFAPGPLAVASAVVVPRGNVRGVAGVLAAEGVIRHERVFELAAILTSYEGPLHAAELAFPAHASLAVVLHELRSGSPVLHRLTLPEGLTSAQVAHALADAAWLTGPVRVPAEGSVLPQTYAFERGTSRDKAISRAAAAMRAMLSGAWLSRAPGLRLRNAREALVLASLIERETGIASERPIVARVFLNRLQSGMKLQSDPTAGYGASGGMSLERALDRADLARKDAYNTYVVAGLPAAPICNPGRAAIEAALHPAQTAALYFVADGKGGHVFADTLAAHLRNVEALRARR